MHSSFSFAPLSSFEFVCREKEFDVVAARRRPLDQGLPGDPQVVKTSRHYPLTTAAAAVIHKAEKNKAGRSSQKAPFPSTGNYFFQSPGASASQTTES